MLQKENPSAFPGDIKHWMQTDVVLLHEEKRGGGAQHYSC